MNLFGIFNEGWEFFLYKKGKMPKFGGDTLVFSALKFYTEYNRLRTVPNKQGYREGLLRAPGGKENRGRLAAIQR